MLKHALRLSVACAALAAMIPAGPAMAAAPEGFAGSIDGNYSHLSTSGSSINMWGGDAAGAFGFGNSNLAAEGDVGYHSLSDSGTSVQVWNAAGHFIYAPMGGRLGATIQYETINCCGTNVHVTDYGLFGEAFLDNVTVGGNFGGVSAEANTFFGGGSANGWYGSAGFTGYVIPNLGLTGMINYTHFSGGSITNYTAAAEWLISEFGLPLSIYGGYTYTQLSNSGADHLDQWFLGLKVYTNGNGMTLMDKHRNGTLDRIVQPTLLLGG
jgi:hypothetical protein